MAEFQDYQQSLGYQQSQDSSPHSYIDLVSHGYIPKKKKAKSKPFTFEYIPKKIVAKKIK